MSTLIIYADIRYRIHSVRCFRDQGVYLQMRPTCVPYLQLHSCQLLKGFSMGVDVIYLKMLTYNTCRFPFESLPSSQCWLYWVWPKCHKYERANEIWEKNNVKIIIESHIPRLNIHSIQLMDIKNWLTVLRRRTFYSTWPQTNK